MLLSNSSLLKNANVTQNTQTKSIVTKAEVPVQPQNQTFRESLPKELSPEEKARIIQKIEEREMQRIAEERQQILTQTQTEIRAMKETAKIEIEQLKEQAYAQAFEEGREQGEEAGYQEGLNQANQDTSHWLDEARQSAEKISEENLEYLQSMREKLIEFTTQLAGQLIQKQLTLEPETILAIVEPMLQKNEKPDQLVTVRASAQYYSVLVDYLEQKKLEQPGFRYIVLKDPRLSAYEISVDTDESLLTFQLEDELQLYLKQVKGME